MEKKKSIKMVAEHKTENCNKRCVRDGRRAKKEEEREMAWTRGSYDAVHDWLDSSKRPAIKRILLLNGLDDVVRRLENMSDFGEWYAITREAAEAVGSKIVEHSAQSALFELKKYESPLDAPPTEEV